MSNTKMLLQGMLVASTLLLAACHDGTTSSNASNPVGVLTVAVPGAFPYNTEETISVTLAVSPAPTAGLGFSDLTLVTNPHGSASLLTIASDSSCNAITTSSTETSCTFAVTNHSSTGQAALDATGYYVTGQLNGQTVTSNVAYPGTPPPSGTYWTMNIDNVTGANQYLFVFGQNLQVSGNPYEVVVFNGSNYGTVQAYSAGTPYGSNEDSIIITPGTHAIYIPYGIYGGRIYLSNAQMHDLELTSDGGIETPSFTYNGGSNLNYDTVFDDFEFTYAADIVTGIPHAVVNQTQVDALAVPICIDGTSSYVPITQAGFCGISRSTLLTDVTTGFDAVTNVPLKSQWNTTVLLDSSDAVLRVMNPGSASALAGTSPITSFATYLDTYVGELVASNDYLAPNSLKVSLDGTAIISGKIIAGSPATYTFTCAGGACNGQSGTMPLTSANLLTGAPPGGANNATKWAYEMVSSAFMAGQLPPTSSPSVITQDYLRGKTATFYDSNSVSSGSEYQYSVFSNILKGVQLDGTYTFPYNDVLGVSSTMTETLTSSTDKPDPIKVTVTY